jgi:hypothetical protein
VEANSDSSPQGQTLSLSLARSLATLVTPTTSTPVQDNISLISPLVFHLASSHLDRDAQRQVHWSVDGPRGSETPTVGAPGRGLLRVDKYFPVEVPDGEPSAAFSAGDGAPLQESRVHVPRRQLRHGTPPLATRQQRRSSARPAAANSTTTSPRGRRGASEFAPPPSSPEEEKTGQPWPGRRRHLVGCRTRASRRCRHPCGGHAGCCPRT